MDLNHTKYPFLDYVGNDHPTLHNLWDVVLSYYGIVPPQQGDFYMEDLRSMFPSHGQCCRLMVNGTI